MLIRARLGRADEYKRLARLRLGRPMRPPMRAFLVMSVPFAVHCSRSIRQLAGFAAMGGEGGRKGGRREHEGVREGRKTAIAGEKTQFLDEVPGADGFVRAFFVSPCRGGSFDGGAAKGGTTACARRDCPVECINLNNIVGARIWLRDCNQREAVVYKAVVVHQDAPYRALATPPVRA